MDDEPTSDPAANPEEAPPNDEGLQPNAENNNPESEGPPADSGDRRDLPQREGVEPVLTRRVIGHLVDAGIDGDMSEPRRKAYTQALTITFRYIADLLDLGPKEATERKMKSVLYHAIVDKVSGYQK